MEAASLVGAMTSVFVLLVQCIMLWLQLGAFRRHGHRSFVFLAASSAIGILYSLLFFPLYLMRLTESTYWTLVLCSTALVLVGAPIGVFGTFLLFRSYAKLAERTDKNSVVGT